MSEIAHEMDGQLMDLRGFVREQVADDGHSAAFTKLITQGDDSVA